MKPARGKQFAKGKQRLLPKASQATFRSKRIAYCPQFCSTGICQTFRCRKEHDRSKVAICSKFIQNKCTNVRCTLSHCIRAGMMPDCIFFRRGGCTQPECQYRHVKVNLNAGFCKHFLQGYCRFELECRNRHAWPCRSYTSNGKCEKGDQCTYAHAIPTKRVQTTNNPSSKKIKTQNVNDSQQQTLATTSSQLEQTPADSIQFELSLLASLRRRIAERVVTDTKQPQPLGEFVALCVANPVEGDTLADGTTQTNTDEVELVNEVAKSNESDKKARLKSDKKTKTFVMDNEQMTWPEYLMSMASDNDGSRMDAASRPALKIIPDYLMTDDIDQHRIDAHNTVDEDLPADDDQSLPEIMCDPLVDVALSNLGLSLEIDSITSV